MDLKINRQKRIAAINDFSGFGRCSLTVSIPIISAMGIQCCAVPTAVLSNHTGYEDYFFDDYTDKMPYYYSKWEKLHLEFDGIYTGFLGSERQVDIVSDFISRFADAGTRVIVDPAMGDDGRTYATMTPGLCKSITRLVRHSDILTPNLTEACILTGMPYSEALTDTGSLLTICHKLAALGGKDIVITGIHLGKDIGNFIYNRDGSCQMYTTPLLGSRRAGTGDVFASVIAADAVNHVPFADSVKAAALFVSKSIEASDALQIPSEDGICFELFLNDLTTHFVDGEK